MSLKHTILGFLGWKQLSGYELKKLFTDTDFIYWSGNNNQIYKSLLELNNAGFITKEVVQQENLPAKKVYTITESGKEELRSWAASPPEFAQVRNTFLMQLAWADGLSADQLNDVAGKYQFEIEMRLAMCREKLIRRTVLPSRNEREAYIWEMLWQREIDYLKCELNWLTRLVNGIQKRSVI